MGQSDLAVFKYFFVAIAHSCRAESEIYTNQTKISFSIYCSNKKKNNGKQSKYGQKLKNSINDLHELHNNITKIKKKMERVGVYSNSIDEIFKMVSCDGTCVRLIVDFLMK